jgi:putative ABC transport system ATP-binding protein
VQEKVSWIPLRDKKKTAYLGVYLALALICSYVESLIPFYFGIPGVKLGLTNIVVVLMLYCVGTKEALAVSALRIVLAGFLFGNMFSILYSLAGGLLSFFVMYLLKRMKWFGVLPVSVSGGIFHNVGQLIVAKGEFCVLLGPSGSGKSTLLNIIGGIDSADSGYISINGDKLEELGEKKLTQYRRKHLGYVFQMYNLIANLNVKENIEVGAYLSDSPLDIDDLLHTLGLYEHRHKLPNQLSGGQQQRVSIGRAIVKNPDILLCDEPTGALDYNTSKEILKLIENVNVKYGNTVIMVTHNEAIRHMADHVIKLRDGAVRHNDINEHKISAADLEW